MGWMWDWRNPVTRAGWLFGLLFGGVHAVYALVNNLNDLDEAGNNLLNNVLLASLVVLFGLAGWWASRTTGQVRTGILAALLVWLVSTVIGLAALWIVTFAYMEVIRHNTGMLQDFARSSARDMDTFIVEDALGVSLFGSAAVLGLGTICGAVGASIGKQREPAVTARA